MSSFVQLCVIYVCGVEGLGSRGETNIMQDGAVDIQHGTGVDGNFYSMHPRPPSQVKVLWLEKTYKNTLLYLVHNTAG
jgi:hypothetical protein